MTNFFSGDWPLFRGPWPTKVEVLERPLPVAQQCFYSWTDHVSVQWIDAESYSWLHNPPKHCLSTFSLVCLLSDCCAYIYGAVCDGICHYCDRKCHYMGKPCENGWVNRLRCHLWKSRLTWAKRNDTSDGIHVGTPGKYDWKMKKTVAMWAVPIIYCSNLFFSHHTQFCLTSFLFQS